jgi:hypothetical protein
MKLTKEQLYYLKYDGKVEELWGINFFNILGSDTVRVLEIPSHVERIEIESINVYGLFTSIDNSREFPQLKKLILPQKFRELIINGRDRTYGKFTIQQNGSMIYNGNLTFEIVFK